MRHNAIVLLFTLKTLLCLKSISPQLYAQVPSAQTLRLMSQIGLGYEIICVEGLYTESFLVYDTLLNDCRKICIKQYRIKGRQVAYEFILDETIGDNQRQSPIVVQRFWDGRAKRYKRKKSFTPNVPMINYPFELTCISENPYKQERYMFSITDVPSGLPIEICNYLWQCLSSCTIYIQNHYCPLKMEEK